MSVVQFQGGHVNVSITYLIGIFLFLFRRFIAKQDEKFNRTLRFPPVSRKTLEAGSIIGSSMFLVPGSYELGIWLAAFRIDGVLPISTWFYAIWVFLATEVFLFWTAGYVKIFPPEVHWKSIRRDIGVLFDVPEKYRKEVVRFPRWLG